MKTLLLLLAITITSCASKAKVPFGKKPYPAMQSTIERLVKRYKQDPNYAEKLKEKVDQVKITAENRSDFLSAYCVIEEDRLELVINHSYWENSNEKYQYEVIAYGLTQCLYYPPQSGRLIRSIY